VVGSIQTLATVSSTPSFAQPLEYAGALKRRIYLEVSRLGVAGD